MAFYKSTLFNADILQLLKKSGYSKNCAPTPIIRQAKSQNNILQLLKKSGYYQNCAPTPIIRQGKKPIKIRKVQTS